MRAGSQLNKSAIAGEAGLDSKTFSRYLDACSHTFITFELQSWAKPNRLNKRFTRSPKLYFYDTNLLCYLMRRDLETIYRDDPITMGHVFENFIAAEFIKNAANLPGVTISYFRTTDQKEVDFVLEKPDGSTLGIEVKLSGSPDKHDFAALKLLEDVLGRKLTKGIVLYTGSDIIPFADNMWAVPASFLR
jgi:predicted AAA+ superfamily ATPase